MNMETTADLAAFTAWLQAQQGQALDGMTASVHSTDGTFARHSEEFDAAITARRFLHQYEIAQNVGGAA